MNGENRILHSTWGIHFMILINHLQFEENLQAFLLIQVKRIYRLAIHAIYILQLDHKHVKRTDINLQIAVN